MSAYRTNRTMIVAAILASGACQAMAQSELSKAAGAMRLGFDSPIPGEEIDFTLHRTGDFNKDGYLDLLMLSDNGAWVLCGNADGGYDPFGPYEQRSQDYMFLAGQFDADPEPEVAYALNTGYGITYAPGAEPVEVIDPNNSYNGMFGEPRGDEFTRTMRAGDLDGDGIDELIFNTRINALYIDWSQGGDAVAFPVPDLGEENSIYKPQDYDGDGDLDLLAFNRAMELFILIEGTGTSTLGPVRMVDGDYPRISENDRPVFGQLDANPAMDLIVCDRIAGTISIVYNFVTTFRTTEPIVVDQFVTPVALVDDIDGSGAPDLVVMMARQGSFSYYQPMLLSDPAGGAPALLDLDIGMPTATPYHPPSLVDLNDELVDVVSSFDVDHDGDSDLVWHFIRDHVLGEDGRRSLWATENRRGESGSPLIGAPSYPIVSDARHLLPVDTDFDGQDEFVIARSGDGNMRILDLGQSGLGRVLNSEGAFMSVAADLDNDGIPEIVTGADIASELRIFPLSGNSIIRDRIVVSAPDGSGPYAGLETGDFNGDGYEDVAATEQDGPTDIYIGGPGPSLTHWAEVSPTIPHGIKPGVLDFNADGLSDLVLGSEEVAFNLQLFTNNGDGTFTAQPGVMPRNFDLDPYWITTGDIDSDGVEDIVSVSRSIFTAVVFFLSPDGTVDEFKEVLTDSSLEVAIADATGDGAMDLILTGDTFGRVSVVPQTGPRLFGRPVQLPGYAGEGVALSDLDGDGRSEILMVSDDEQRVRVHTATASVCPADLNADGELNFFDVSQFLVDQPDYNSDGVFNFFDVAGFIADYLAGCP